MELQETWNAFAGTGNILLYLDYRQQAQLMASSTGETDDGNHCNTGACPEGDPL